MSEQLSLLVSCYTKELGTSGYLRITNRSHPFILPGLGEPGIHCMKCVVYGIGINGDKIGTRNLKCKRIECPNCYKNWVLDRVFETTFKLEAYAIVTGDRPSHVVSSIDPMICKLWDNLEFYDTFHRRSYRHIASMGGTAGLRVSHPYRIRSEIKTKLKSVGYGVPGNGYWKGVRDNALNLPRLEEYYSLAVHDHNIVFPSFLNEHKDRNFVVRKIGVLDTVEDIIKLLYYLISHAGVLKESEAVDNHPIVCFGDLHRFSPEKFLSEKEILDLKNKIAEKLHCKFVNGELIPISEEEKPSNKDDFYPISEFVMYSKEQDSWINAIVSSFPFGYQGFWLDMILEYNDKILDTSLSKGDRYLFMNDIRLPDGIESVEVI